jgi:hypothetical protein
MQIQIESSCLDEPRQSRAALEQCVHFVFRRLQCEVRHARISLRDINGPRGGVDKQCRLILKTDGHGTLVVTSQALSSAHAVDDALRRASQSLVRIWQRKREPKRALPKVDPLGLLSVS